MHTPDDMTWYARRIVNNEAVYDRRVVRKVNWQDRKAANVIKAGFLEADRVAIYVPTLVGGVDRSKDLAFGLEDVLVKGIVSDEIAGGFGIDDFIRKYPYSVKVRSIDHKVYPLNPGMSHIQLGGA